MKTNRLVVASAQWAEDLPQWLLDTISEERTMHGIMAASARTPQGIGDAEICAYLFTASMRGPITYEQTQIYTHLCAKIMKRRGLPILDFMQEALDKGLNDQETYEYKILQQDLIKARGGDIHNPLIDALKMLSKVTT